MVAKKNCGGDSGLLFFILVFLLLFYDSSSIGILSRGWTPCTDKPQSQGCTLLFFILVFLELFY